MLLCYIHKGCIPPFIQTIVLLSVRCCNSMHYKILITKLHKFLGSILSISIILNIFIELPLSFSARDLNLLNRNTLKSSFIVSIRNNQIFLLSFSMNMMKYLFSLNEGGSRGPHTSQWITFNTSVDLWDVCELNEFLGYLPINQINFTNFI